MRAIRLVPLAALVATLLVVTAPSASATDTWTTKAVGLPVTDVVVNPSSGKLLATVAGSNPSVGKELLELAPATGTIARHVFVGSEPSHLAVSDDGTTAYVGLAGGNSITRVDLETFTTA